MKIITSKLTNEEKKNLNDKHWTHIRNIPQRECEERGICTTAKEYKCNKCGAIKTVLRSNYGRAYIPCDNGCWGVAKGSNKVIKGINDIATTHPHLISLLINKEDGTSYSAGSSKKVWVRCPICNNKKEMKVIHLVKHGVMCTQCGDGVSYPERVVSSVLQNLGLNFIAQLSKRDFDWCSNKRYDFYIPSLNAIIETHGGQHYEGFTKGWGKTYEEVEQNDLYKEKLARKNGVKHYFTIDCSKSNLEHIKNSLISSPLANLVPINLIDWTVVEKESENSLFYEVIKKYKKDSTNLDVIAEEVGMGIQTVRNYLKKGAKMGLCDYNPRESMSRHYSKICKKITVVNEDFELIGNYEGITECSVKFGHDTSTISRLCLGKGSCNKTKPSHFIKNKEWGKIGFYFTEDLIEKKNTREVV